MLSKSKFINEFAGIAASPVLILQAKSDGSGGTDVKLRCDGMDLAAEFVQDMCKYFKISELESVIDFPVELKIFEQVSKCIVFYGLSLIFLIFWMINVLLNSQVLTKVADFNASRVRLTADMADDSQQVKVSMDVCINVIIGIHTFIHFILLICIC